jgi:sugar phosphate isomerase/epimerase
VVIVIELIYLLLRSGLVYHKLMKPRIAICNIFDQDADRLLDFALLNGFEGIDWTIAKDQSEKVFSSQMKKLMSLEVRFHCAFPGIDFAYADSRSDRSMKVLTQTIERIALVGGRHMTVHTGFGHVSAGELDLKKAKRNLTILVERGLQCGVCVSLENLSSHWTRDPELFAELIAQSGAGVTLDIGHIHASNSPDGVETSCERYILPHENKIFNAHIYHTEREGSGHVAPGTLEVIYDRLELLRRVEACTWWVIELKNSRDILHTRDLLAHYIATSFFSPLLDHGELKTPQHFC